MSSYSSFVRFDGMTWPNPTDPMHAESTHNRLRAVLTSDRAATEGGGERG